MCRWFAYISHSEPCLLEDVLIHPAHAITKPLSSQHLPKLLFYDPTLSDADLLASIRARNISLRYDGLGIGFYTEPAGCPHLYKTVRAPLEDADLLSLCSNTRALTVFAHVRNVMGASTPRETNNHPFAFGRHLFMHHGSVAHFTVIRGAMRALISSRALATVRGETDTEHVAALYMTYLGDDWDRTYSVAEMKRALDKTIGTILRLQRNILSAEQLRAASSLNLCVTDGKQLAVVRFRNHEREHPPTLYYSTTAGITLNRKSEHGKHVIIANEPPTTCEMKDWTLLEKNEALMVDGDMNLTREPVHFDAAVDET